MKEAVTLNEKVEDIVARFPEASGFLLKQGVICVRCGEPAWCSLGELIAQKHLDGDSIISGLNEFLGVSS